MSQYFPKPFRSFGRNINVKVDLSITQQKQILEIFHMLILQVFALKTNLANLKNEVDNLDINKLKTVPDDLSKLRNAVTNDVIKKADYNAKITEIENKIPDINKLATKTALKLLKIKYLILAVLLKRQIIILQ